MLVLSRKCLEAVAVGNSAALEPMVKVTVIEVIGGRVKLGFEAEDHISVHRWEIWERIRAAARAGPSEGAPTPAV